MRAQAIIYTILLGFVAALPVRDEVTVGDSLDISVPMSAADLLSIKNQQFSTIYIQAYDPYGLQSYATKMTQTIKDAYTNKFNVELIMTPNAYSLTDGYVQVQRLYTGLDNNGIPAGKLWIDVNTIGAWPTNTTANCAFLYSMLHRARFLQFTQIGIFTNANAWNSITGNWKEAGNDVQLWYSNTNGSGTAGETPKSFDDFTPFGNWTQAIVKQYGVNELVSNIYVNRDIFVQPSTTA